MKLFLKEIVNKWCAKGSTFSRTWQSGRELCHQVNIPSLPSVESTSKHQIWCYSIFEPWLGSAGLATGSTHKCQYVQQTLILSYRLLTDTNYSFELVFSFLCRSYEIAFAIPNRKNGIKDLNFQWQSIIFYFCPICTGLQNESAYCTKSRVVF